MPSNLQVNHKYKHPFIFANVFLLVSFISLGLYFYSNLMEIEEEIVAHHKKSSFLVHFFGILISSPLT
jgi:hypothetical protein